MKPSLSFSSIWLRLFRGWMLALAILFLWSPANVWAQQGSGEPRTVEVQAGDTLVGISERLGVPLAALMEANQISDPNVIWVGQVLVVPEVTVPVPPGVTTYALTPADNLFTLADRLMLLPQDLLMLNRGMQPAYFRLEPEIFVPEQHPAVWPNPVLAFRHSPEIVQGQCGVVELVLSRPLLPTGTFGETKLHFFLTGRRGQRYHYRALLPTPALLEPGDYDISVQVADTTLRTRLPVLAGSYDTQYIVLPPDKGALLAPQRVQAELAKLHQVWDVFQPARLWRGSFRFPIGEGFQRTSPYGTRRSYNGGPVSSFHSGSDWGAPEGTPIAAPAAGIVILAESLDVRGGAVILDHGQGITSSFWHLSQIDVQAGQRVSRGEQIGLVGTTGLSTGAHLHWEVRVGGVPVDPMQWTQTDFPFVPLVDAQSSDE